MKNKFLGTGEEGYHPLRKIKTVFSGFQYAVKYDFSVTYKLVLSAIVLVVAFIFRELVDFLLLMTATVLVVMAELFNSAIEALCDFVEERHNEKIKVIKDIAAAAVGMSILLWVTVMVMEIWQLL
ncbi:diacylglycerol kinase [Thiothrix sp.]|jgi:diacylglycerol kinase (ATP)|uniref:diacylglycerol kinase n=1 Tax=Thiothrix sp. TaxID=1032 RepID=UPI0025803519|nr:diacylglycerol kinase [Thiothrix sp.]